jgi:hypothetical protein
MHQEHPQPVRRRFLPTPYGSTIANRAPAIATLGEGLVQQSDLVWEGSFRFPSGGAGGPSGQGYASGGLGLSYNSVNNSLFASGHSIHVEIGEISIPELIKSESFSALNRASVIQNLTRISPPDFGPWPEGQWYTAGTWPADNGDLVIGIYAGYDAVPVAERSHLVISGGVTDITGAQNGLYKIGAQNPAYYGGPMAAIPPNWRTSFGGMPVIAGLSGMSINARQSMGPCCAGFNPTTLGPTTAPEAEMVHYPYYGGGSSPDDHPITDPLSQNTLYNVASGIRGMAFIDNCVLFFGSHGSGELWYGENGDFPDKHDPCYTDKRHHGYPYRSQVWAYRASDLALVAAGSLEPWQLLPYAVWQFDMPMLSCTGAIYGVATDHANRRIYITCHNVPSTFGGSFGQRAVHCYSIAP